MGFIRYSQATQNHQLDDDAGICELRKLFRSYSSLFVISIAVLALSACAAVAPAPVEEGLEFSANNARLSPITKYDLPTPEPVIVPDVTAVVNTVGSRANVRSGPALDSKIIAKALPGDSFTVVGESDDGKWLEVCCITDPEDPSGETKIPAWISASVVDLDGNAGAVPVTDAVFTDTVESTWKVDWTCGSDRCEVKECGATVAATSDTPSTNQWLQVEHTVTWDDNCFDEDSWVFEVDRFSAKERSGEFSDNFLYNYWLGIQPGPATNTFTMDDGRKVAVYCSGPHELDLEENNGWTTRYVGETCHDVKTGELVSVSYTKRWLFTGEYDGQKYERAYFGDYEVLEQHLVDTNAELAFIDD